MKAHIVLEFDIINKAGYTHQEIGYVAQETTHKLLTGEHKLNLTRSEPQVFPIVKRGQHLGTMTITMDGQPVPAGTPVS